MRILFLPYHGYGHIHPQLAVASMLRTHGHEVFMAGTTFFQGYVTQQGFSYTPLQSVPFGMNFEDWVNQTKKKRWVYFASLKDRITDGLYVHREKELRAVLDAVRPDVIVLDGTQATDFIVLYPLLKQRGIRVAVLHAMLPTHVLPGRPPVNSDVFPSDEEGCEDALWKLEEKQTKKQERQKFKYAGFDDVYILSRRMKKNRVPEKYWSSLRSLLNFSIDCIPQYIIAPRAFDFPDFKNQPYHHYLGFLVGTKMTSSNSREFAEALPRLLERKQREQRKLLYCAFGTLEGDQKKLITLFLNKLIAIVKQTPHLLIVSTKQKNELTSPLPDNVYVFDFVQQTLLLQHTDLFISHGGFNSVSESIQAEVPMLLYPVHDAFDPRGNSTRVVYHGMGLRGDVQEPEAEVLEKISELLGNPLYKQCLRKMNEANEACTAERFIAAFQPVLVD
ncbi:glycosyltransferase [Chryseolinea lacunae]|uniref:Glycosyltransferase family 1 protein n=1 Tax=Chryseolinea lacunae TaxID=2801331 RepID=A0ABS1KXB8_9BACT|nr:glycosyltransferase [Chryseolinea lacunae]MBL0742941.1 glycosyltransferase family 1 protein [Chryseolinea lacunae]